MGIIISTNLWALERAKRDGSIVSFNQINLRDAFAKSIDLVEILVENRKEDEAMKDTNNGSGDEDSSDYPSICSKNHEHSLAKSANRRKESVISTALGKRRKSSRLQFDSPNSLANQSTLHNTKLNLVQLAQLQRIHKLKLLQNSFNQTIPKMNYLLSKTNGNGQEITSQDNLKGNISDKMYPFSDMLNQLESTMFTNMIRNDKRIGSMDSINTYASCFTHPFNSLVDLDEDQFKPERNSDKHQLAIRNECIKSRLPNSNNSTEKYTKENADRVRSDKEVPLVVDVIDINRNYEKDNFKTSKQEEATRMQTKHRLIFKKPIFPFQRQNSTTSRLESPGSQNPNLKKSILKNRLAKKNSSQFDSAEDDFETFMNLFNRTKHATKRPVSNQ